MLDATTWPSVPIKDRPKYLYTNSSPSPEESDLLISKGWEVVDVRLLPSTTDAERAHAIKAWLEGIRTGTIETTPKLKDFLELEAKTCGLIGNKIAQDDIKPIVKDDLDSLLDFKSNRAFKGQELKVEFKKRGKLQ